MPCMILPSDAATRYCHRALPALQKSRLISLRDEAASQAETVSDRQCKFLRTHAWFSAGVVVEEFRADAVSREVTLMQGNAASLLMLAVLRVWVLRPRLGAHAC